MSLPEIAWRLIREWRRVQRDGRPWGMWIREYPALPPDADEIPVGALPVRTWFVDDAGPREESVWKWVRFEATRPLDQSDSGRALFSIGRAAFAPYASLPHVYSEAVWGPLYGHGERWARPQNGQAQPEGLWRA